MRVRVLRETPDLSSGARAPWRASVMVRRREYVACDPDRIEALEVLVELLAGELEDCRDGD